MQVVRNQGLQDCTIALQMVPPMREHFKYVVQIVNGVQSVIITGAVIMQ